MDDRERELDESVDDLAATLEALREELQDPPEGPLGLPRPPTPGEFLRFTEQYTIPALISILETSIRTLELLAAALRVADGRPLDGPSGGRRGADDPRADRIASASRRTLRALDDALADLQSAAAGGEPQNPELQRLLSEARDLRAEVDDRLADATADPADRPAEPGPGPESRSGPEPVNIEVKGGDDEAEDDEDDPGERDVGVDVDSELESIKRELDEPPEELDGESRRDSGLEEDNSDDDGVGVDDTPASDESDPGDDPETPN
ncbi:hypothetical protein HWV07_02645 [Natronomonas salina]|uniref:DUF7547 family protein n=1 Tax=Natronomonas salina TaxID=1710540 RepID=UPI0015B4E334|nr:hypothetical protein [Natronomonas salina]QLD87993.1 hypothetical protein HWV07_02645 [Natronomonas salina]